MRAGRTSPLLLGWTEKDNRASESGIIEINGLRSDTYSIDGE